MARMRWWVLSAAAWAALGTWHHPAAWAAEAIVDEFSDASNLTAFVPDTNVLRNSLGSTVRVDPGLNNVIGGARELTVTATALAVPGLDYIVVGANLTPDTFFEYNSRSGADGSTSLRYDGNGSGLNAYLAFAQGIRVLIREADAAAVSLPGMAVTVTLTDGSMASASQTQTLLVPVLASAPLALDYLFSAFAGVDPSDLFSIEVALDPQVAGDTRLQIIGTFGTPPLETTCNDGIDNDNDGFIDCRDPDCITFTPCGLKAPVLSPTAATIAFVLLSLIGLGALRRLRRQHG